MTGLRRSLRDYVDTVPGGHRPHPLRAGVAALLVLAVALVVAFGGWRPWAGDGRTVRAEFTTADQLVPGRTPVRVAGVQVGEVRAVEPAGRDDRTVVVLALRDDDIRVARDATAHIRIRTVLSGTRYVDLVPGSPSAPPLGDRTIPAARTTSQVDWDDVTQVFEPEVRRAHQGLLRGLREALADPTLTRRGLDATGPGLAALDAGLRPLTGRRAGDLARLVRSTGRVTRALTADRGALEALVGDAASVTRATDRHRAALGRSVALAPAALEETTATMRRLHATLEHLDPLVADLRPGARALGPAVRSLRPAAARSAQLLGQARPLLADLRPALRDLAAAGRAGVPLVERLEPVVARANDELLPWLHRRDEDTRLRLFEAIGPFFAVTSSSAGDFDARGHFLHFPITPTADSVLLPCGPDVWPGHLKNCAKISAVLRRALVARKGRGRR